MNQLNYLNSRKRYQFIPRTLIFINHENKYLLMGNMAISMAISSSISKLIADNTIVIKERDNMSADDIKKKKEVK